MNTPHTPAPWIVGTVRIRPIFPGFYEVPIHVASSDPRVGYGNCIAIAHLGGVGGVDSRLEACMANAVLISKAPELLQALKDVLASTTPSYDGLAAWERARDVVVATERLV